MQFRRRLTPNAKVDLIPMIDVVFQLVVFFMVSSTFIVTPGINIVLPRSETAEPVVMSKIVITVASRNEIYLNKDRYDLESLNEEFSKMGEEQREQIKTVVIEGDREVSYSLLVEVLDVLRKHGFKGVNLKMREETG
jgi:biopolymer transport protein ExbD